MLFSDEFIESIINNPIDGIMEILNSVDNAIDDTPIGWSDTDYSVLFEGFTLICSIFDHLQLNTDTVIPTLTGDFEKDCNTMRFFLSNIRKEYQEKHIQIRFNTTKNRFDALLKQSFSYEFSQGDLNRVQELINELREEISKSQLFEAKHKARLLKRLEKLQSELHKKMSDIDTFWGLVGDAGVAIGKFGKDAKPFVDRIREITDIVWRTQSRAEELPSGTPTPLLENF